MTDFLDRYGDQLRHARLPRRRRWRGGVIAGLATLAVATPVVALTAPDRTSLSASGLPDTYKLVQEGDQLCLNGPSSRLACLPEADAATHGLTIIAGREGKTRYAGVVPDKVARVRFLPPAGVAVETPVTGNFFTFVVDEARTNAPHLLPTGLLVPPPAAVRPGELQWLDANGDVITRPPLFVRAR